MGSCPLLAIQISYEEVHRNYPQNHSPMELLEHFLPDASTLSLKHWTIEPESHQMVITVCSTQVVTCCPLCQSLTGRVHSRYERTLKDLPLDQFGLTLVLEVAKFFCLNEACRRRIFTERLPTIVAPWARRTRRYAEQLTALGLSLGGDRRCPPRSTPECGGESQSVSASHHAPPVARAEPPTDPRGGRFCPAKRPPIGDDFSGARNSSTDCTAP